MCCTTISINNRRRASAARGKAITNILYYNLCIKDMLWLKDSYHDINSDRIKTEWNVSRHWCIATETYTHTFSHSEKCGRAKLGAVNTWIFHSKWDAKYKLNKMNIRIEIDLYLALILSLLYLLSNEVQITTPIYFIITKQTHTQFMFQITTNQLTNFLLITNVRYQIQSTMFKQSSI